ncbi:MAG TPA: TIGR03085 family metal-binding protein [Micromonosporaceae bacterium]
MTSFARSERAALADLMLRLGPDAPTLCTGWRTRELAAHLVIRERRPDAAAGVLLAPFAGYTDRVLKQTAAGDYRALVDRVAEPPWWSPLSNPLVHEVTNLLEFFVHHEDVLRAQPGWRADAPDAVRDLPRGESEALWSRVAFAGARLRRLPVRTTLVAPGFGERGPMGDGPPVRVIGAPGELALFCLGRQRAAVVEVDGESAAGELLLGARLGI